MQGKGLACSAHLIYFVFSLISLSKFHLISFTWRRMCGNSRRKEGGKTHAAYYNFNFNFIKKHAKNQIKLNRLRFNNNRPIKKEIIDFLFVFQFNEETIPYVICLIVVSCLPLQ